MRIHIIPRDTTSKGMYAYIKHFAFNDQEDHRGDRPGQYGAATWLNEQSARELYLLPFEMCMKNGEVELNYIRENGIHGRLSDVEAGADAKLIYASE